MLVPFIFSFHPALRFNKTWRSFFTANSLVAIGFIAWDMLFTKLGVWGFNPDYLCGLYVYNLPIEEILFFICIPYASLFTYHCLRIFFKEVALPARSLSILLIVLLLCAGLFYFSRLYTASTCLALSLVIFLIAFRSKASWLPNFYLSYLVILLPFFIVNGILTGSWIDEPVVWYNNAENCGMRMLTIPVEDVFYGMLLLILNTWLYESFERQKKA